jgi:hypothetical protein
MRGYRSALLVLSAVCATGLAACVTHPPKLATVAAHPCPNGGFRQTAQLVFGRVSVDGKGGVSEADFARFLGPHRCRYATDDGSLGRKGPVTDLVSQALEGGVRWKRLFACGPLPMFRTLAAIVEEAKLDASFALESEMACGFGVCLGCVAPTADGRFATVCTEGPCVPPSAVDWSRV